MSRIKAYETQSAHSLTSGDKQLVTGPAKEIRIMSVGPSGVGKSTIGNKLLGLKSKDPTYLQAEAAATSVTQEPTTVTSGHVTYTDVPGIPDTNPNNTKKFYNMIIEEAKKPCTAIFFVFDVGNRLADCEKARIKQCALLFDEINNSSALKILILNDTKADWPNPDGLDEDEDEKEFLDGKEIHDGVRQKAHEEYKAIICEVTGIKFFSTAVLYGLKTKIKGNMRDTLKLIMNNLKEFERIKSDHLRTFDELKEIMNSVIKNKNISEHVMKAQSAIIDRLEKEYEDLKIRYDSIFRIQKDWERRSQHTWANVLTLGVNWVVFKGYKIPVDALAYLRSLPMLAKEKELQEARDMLDIGHLENTIKEYEEKLRRFQELKEAMAIK